MYMCKAHYMHFYTFVDTHKRKLYVNAIIKNSMHTKMLKRNINVATKLKPVL